MSQVATVPPAFEMSPTEELPFTFDTSALLASGESPSSPSARLRDQAGGGDYAAGLVGSPTVAGNLIAVTVGFLQAGHSYILGMAFTASAGKVWEMRLVIRCVPDTEA